MPTSEQKRCIFDSQSSTDVYVIFMWGIPGEYFFGIPILKKYTVLCMLYFRNRTYILMWSHPWKVKTEGPTDGGDVDGKCVITYNRSKIRQVEAIVFHYTALDYEVMPWRHYR